MFNVKINISRDSRNPQFEYASYNQDKMLYGFAKHELPDISVNVEGVLDSDGAIASYTAKADGDYEDADDNLVFKDGEEIILTPNELNQVDDEIASKRGNR